MNQEFKFCSQCGEKTATTAQFCGKCGQEFGIQNAPSSIPEEAAPTTELSKHVCATCNKPLTATNRVLGSRKCVACHAAKQWKGPPHVCPTCNFFGPGPTWFERHNAKIALCPNGHGMNLLESPRHVFWKTFFSCFFYNLLFSFNAVKFGWVHDTLTAMLWFFVVVAILYFISFRSHMDISNQYISKAEPTAQLGRQERAAANGVLVVLILIITGMILIISGNLFS